MPTAPRSSPPTRARSAAPRILASATPIFIGGLIGQLGYDRSNSLLDPTKGFRLLGRVNPEASLGDGTESYLRNQLDGSVYYPVGESFVLAGRARLGSIFGIAARRARAVAALLCRRRRLGARLRLPGARPADRRGQSGFRSRPIPTRRPIRPCSIPLGGRSLIEFAVEGRYRFGNYGVVGFVDAGQVYESQYPELRRHALRRRRRRPALHQFRPAPARRRDADRPPRGRIAGSPSTSRSGRPSDGDRGRPATRPWSSAAASRAPHRRQMDRHRPARPRRRCRCSSSSG